MIIPSASSIVIENDIKPSETGVIELILNSLENADFRSYTEGRQTMFSGIDFPIKIIEYKKHNVEGIIEYIIKIEHGSNLHIYVLNTLLTETRNATRGSSWSHYYLFGPIHKEKIDIIITALEDKFGIGLRL